MFSSERTKWKKKNGRIFSWVMPKVFENYGSTWSPLWKPRFLFLNQSTEVITCGHLINKITALFARRNGSWASGY